MITNTGDIYSKNIINEDTLQSNYIEIKNNTDNIIKINNDSIQYSKDGTTYYNLIKPGAGLNSVILNNGGNVASGQYAYAEGNNTTASGESSHAEGMAGTTASALGSHAEGGGTQAKLEYAHSEGVYTTAEGAGAHAEGFTNYNNRLNDNIKSWAYGRAAHAEGVETQAKAEAAHSEGNRTKATGKYSHAEGNNTLTGKIISGEGTSTKPYVYSGGDNSHAEGKNTQTIGLQSHAGGEGTVADKDNMTAIGQYNIYDKNTSILNDGKLFVVGNGTDVNTRSDAFVVYDDGKIVSIDKSNNNKNQIRLNPSINKIQTSIDGGGSWTDYGGGSGSGVGQVYINEGDNVQGGEIFNDYSNNKAISENTHAEGSNTTAGNRTITRGTGTEQDPYVYTYSGQYSHAEGINTIASGVGSHAEGGYVSASYINKNNTASGIYSHAEGAGTEASSECAHAEGWVTFATADEAHAEGCYCQATGAGSHCEGYGKRSGDNITYNIASGIASHAEGRLTKASGENSHAGGQGTVADIKNMTAIGQYNIYDADENPSLNVNKLFVVGNGTADNDRKDAFVIDKDGNVELSGNLKLTDNTKQIQIGSFIIKPTNNGNTLTIE